MKCGNKSSICPSSDQVVYRPVSLSNSPAAVPAAGHKSTCRFASAAASQKLLLLLLLLVPLEGPSQGGQGGTAHGSSSRINLGLH
jgi:hypothetical protein